MEKGIITNINTHFLYPAALYSSKEPCLVSTILGSCVAVCLWDPYTRSGGINHFMLPLWNGQGLASPKYGNIAIQKLIEKMASFGCRKEQLEAKIFGGGEVIHNMNSHFNIGVRNIEIARQLLVEANIGVKSSNTGGKLGRKILFNTATGEVKHKFINREQGIDIGTGRQPAKIQNRWAEK